jgi:hypothetical protein
VGAEDLNSLAIAFASSVGTTRYKSAVDLDGSGTINGEDLVRLLAYLGAAITPCAP